MMDPKRVVIGGAILVIAGLGCGGGGDAGGGDGGGGDGGSVGDRNPPVCTAGETRCTGDAVEICLADETGWDLSETCEGDNVCVEGACVLSDFQILNVVADPAVFVEGAVTSVTLTATYEGTPTQHQWQQMGGPQSGGLGTSTATSMKVDVSGIQVAAETELSFGLSVTRIDPSSTGLAPKADVTVTESVSVVVLPATIEPALPDGVQVGGSVVDVEVFNASGNEQAIWAVGNRLSVTDVGLTSQPIDTLTLPGFVEDILVVDYLGTNYYALVSMGAEGIAVVALADLSLVTTVGVNFYQDGITFTEGGGAILADNIVEGTRGKIRSLLTDGTSLWIANEAYGIHKTALSNLLGVGGPTLELDGTLLIDSEVFTLLYAGENPWGGPRHMSMVNGKIFVAQGFLGMGIFDATTLDQVGRYNMYTDTNMHEDWFIQRNPADEVQDVGGLYLDAVTGMPDYRQASFEILEVWKGDVVADTPWADFDRYGKFYYNSRSVAVADQGGTSIAYIAYGLGGLVAVDVTGYETATTGTFLDATYLGYAPGVPAHGPDKPIGEQSKSLYPYFGAGMLKEAGAVDVKVVGTNVYFTDHFAGLLVMGGADDPAANWAGVDGTYDNDDPLLGDGVLGDHWPDYEFVTSYDMSPYDPSDHESLPVWMYESPNLLVTGEVGGHGNAIALTAAMNAGQAGQVDVVMTTGSGGIVFLDISSLVTPGVFTAAQFFPTTDELGAAPDGTATQTISIGHTQGVVATDNYLYVADGPHGVSAWQLLDETGLPLDDIHLVANTIQDEYPVTVGTDTFYPAAHAWGVVYDEATDTVLSTCQSVGVRRIDVSGVESGAATVLSPLMLNPMPTDIFEHNGDYGTVDGVQYQDHAYDVALKGSLAYVADGSNGLTVYDLTKDPTVMTSGFLVANIGAGSNRPPLGRAAAIALWTNPADSKEYAFIAASQSGIGVVDVTDLSDMKFVKVFEPKKVEDDKVIKADGRSVDVHVVGDHVYLSYSSFGIVVFTIADLIAPVPDGVDPLQIWKTGSTGVSQYDYRPDHLAKFRLTNEVGYEELDAEALYMEYTNLNDRLVFYVGYGAAGLVRVDWTNPAAPVLLDVAPTVGEATSVAIANGRVFVADHGGGFIQFK